MTFTTCNLNTPLVRQLGGALALLLMLPLALAAQVRETTRTVVALSDSMPVGNAKAVLLFHARPSGNNIVLLPRRAFSIHALGAALQLLDRMEREHGASSNSAMIPIEGVLPPRHFTLEARSELRSILTDVARQPETQIGGLGSGQWLALARPRRVR